MSLHPKLTTEELFLSWYIAAAVWVSASISSLIDEIKIVYEDKKYFIETEHRMASEIVDEISEYRKLNTKIEALRVQRRYPLSEEKLWRVIETCKGDITFMFPDQEIPIINYLSKMEILWVRRVKALTDEELLSKTGVKEMDELISDEQMELIMSKIYNLYNQRKS
jgi:hypothetical protein